MVAASMDMARSETLREGDHHAQVGAALASLADGLRPFVEEALEASHGGDWQAVAREALKLQRDRVSDEGAIRWDAQSLLTIVWDLWRTVFRHRLGHVERSLVSELREFRNRWAHQDEFDFDDAYRVLDDVHRLLRAVSAEQAEGIGRQKRELMRSILVAGELPEPRPRRRIRMPMPEAVVFFVCGAALGLQIVQSFGRIAWPVALLAGVSFTYILFRRLTLSERFEAEERLDRRADTTVSP